MRKSYSCQTVLFPYFFLHITQYFGNNDDDGNASFNFVLLPVVRKVVSLLLWPTEQIYDVLRKILKATHSDNGFVATG